MWGGSRYRNGGQLSPSAWPPGWLLVTAGRREHAVECSGGIQAEMAREQMTMWRYRVGCLNMCGMSQGREGLGLEKEETRRLSGRYSATLRARGDQACPFWPLEGNQG